ncbi:MAG: WD40-repeat-containing domain protein [Benjaminiella poitrasii]|nr:MAG: WD40-repeat-containing domain protein [Benjaminiella poitrasii]
MKADTNTNSSHTTAICIKHKLFRYFRKHSIRQLQLLSPPSDSRIDEGFQQPSKTTTKKSSFITFNRHKIDFLFHLPIELSYIILSYCDQKTIFEACHVSIYWSQLCKDNHLWRHLYVQHHGTIYPAPFNTTTDYRTLYERKLELLERWKHGEQVKMQAIMGHNDSIYCVQFDGTKIVTGSRDRTIKFWRTTSGTGVECYRTLRGHIASVLCLQYDDRILVSGSSDHTVRVWSMQSFDVILCLRGHDSGVLDVCFDEHRIASCSKDATIRVWERRSGQALLRLLGHRGPVNAIQFHGTRLVSASGDAVIKLWDLESGLCLRDFVGHSHGLACIGFDGKKIVSGSNDNKIKVWNADTGECILTCEGHTGLVRSLHFDKDKIVSGSYDQSIRIWNIHTGECLKTFTRCHKSWVFDVTFNETKIISTSQDQRILIIDFAYNMDINHLIKVD